MFRFIIFSFVVVMPFFTLKAQDSLKASFEIKFCDEHIVRRYLSVPKRVVIEGLEKEIFYDKYGLFLIGPPVFVSLEKLGKYRLRFEMPNGKSYFNEIRFTEQQQHFVLCFDEISSEYVSHKPVIERLEEGESYTIKLHSRGCFHSVNETMKIHKENGLLYVDVNGEVHEMTSKERQAILDFETGLNQLISNGMCTTTDTIILEYKQQELRFVDGSCALHLVSDLRNVFTKNKHHE